MSTPTAERREEMLGLLAEKTLALACDLQQQALQADDVDEKVRLSLAFVKVARCTRQCLGLHAKLEKDRLAAEDAAEAVAVDFREGKLELRKSLIREAVQDRMEARWPDEDDIAANDAFNKRLEALDGRLEDLADREDFLDLDPDTFIAELCTELGIDPVSLVAPAPAPCAVAPACGSGDGAEADRIVDGVAPGAIISPKANGHDAPNTS